MAKLIPIKMRITSPMAYRQLNALSLVGIQEIKDLILVSQGYYTGLTKQF